VLIKRGDVQIVTVLKDGDVELNEKETQLTKANDKSQIADKKIKASKASEK
jgi:hypothetical protein